MFSKDLRPFLINGSATKDIVVGKGLRKGDLLSPLLFILVMEGLTRSLKKAVHLRLFNGFKVNEEVTYNIVQFVDDTLFIGDIIWDNIWCIKALLRGFEMILGLRVNFYKSSIDGVNLSS